MKEMLYLRDFVKEEDLINKYHFIYSDDGSCLVAPGNNMYEGIGISRDTRRVTIVIGDSRDKISDQLMCLLYKMIKDDMIGIDEAIYRKDDRYE